MGRPGKRLGQHTYIIYLIFISINCPFFEALFHDGHHLALSFELPHSHSLHRTYTAFPTPLAYITVYCMDIFPPRMLYLSIFYVLRGNNMCIASFLYYGSVCCYHTPSLLLFILLFVVFCLNEREAFMVSVAALVWNALCKESSALCCLTGLRLFHHISFSEWKGLSLVFHPF